MNEVELLAGRASLCTKCSLRQGCTQVVTYRGCTNGALMVVGEAPGANEDRDGLPFVGRSGKLLDEMLCNAGFDMINVYITNAVKCRPPGNRTPENEEIEACKSWLWGEIQLVQPRAIITAGGVPAKTLFGKLSKSQFVLKPYLHKMYVPKWPEPLDKIILCPIYHPSYLLQRGKKFHESTVEKLRYLNNILYNDYAFVGETL